MKRIISLAVLIGLVFLSAIVFALVSEETSSKIKSAKFFLFQETSSLGSGVTIERTFTIFVGDASPSIKSGYIDLKGIVGFDVANQSIDLQIKQQGDAGYSNLQTITFAHPNQSYLFKLKYDATSFFNTKITTAGSYTFVLYVKNNGPSPIDILQGRLTLSYQFTPPSGATGFRSTGSITSSTFDTSATNGAAPNAILWTGTLPATSRVKFQFASSNCSAGQTNPPTCNTGTWSYIGPDGTASTFYEPSGPNVSLKLDLAHHNNKRYFKYKVVLNPTNDATQTPTVTDIILNWAP